MIVFNGTIGACAKTGAWQRAHLVLGHLKTETVQATVAASVSMLGQMFALAWFGRATSTRR